VEVRTATQHAFVAQGKHSEAEAELLSARQEIARLQAAVKQVDATPVSQGEAWQHSEQVVVSALRWATERPPGRLRDNGCAVVLYGARAINAHIMEAGLQLETKDYDLLLLVTSHQDFISESSQLLHTLQALHPTIPVTGDARIPGYLHISVHNNRILDISEARQQDSEAWAMTYGPPRMLLLNSCPAIGHIAVLPREQLKARLLATTSQDYELAQTCFPCGFDPVHVPHWRVEKDRKHLRRLEIVEALGVYWKE